MSHAISEPENLFDRLGGQVGIDAAVDLYYRKVLADERLAHYFVGVDMGRQRLKQTEFLTSAFGGPRRFDSADLAAANEPLIEKGLDDGQFDALVGYLQDALGDLGVAAGLSAEAVAIVESTRPEVVGRKGRRKG